MVSCTTKQHSPLFGDGGNGFPGLSDPEVGAELGFPKVDLERTVVDVAFGREKETAVVSHRPRDDYIDVPRTSVPLGIGEGRAWTNEVIPTKAAKSKCTNIMHSSD
jgi:hypothetical protein